MVSWPRFQTIAPLALGLALLLAACGPTGASTTPTPTVAPTATPVPCATWRIVATPGGATYPDNTLAAVSALSPASAWAVGGNYAEGGTVGPVVSLIERWDGSSWQTVANPGPDFLYGVSALSATDVWAAGSHWDGADHRYKTLTMHWDGTQWSVIPSPSPGPLNDTLSSIAAVSASEVWATGGAVSAENVAAPLVERWDGSSWSVVTTPALPGVTETNLNRVARVPGSHQLWAVGYTVKGPRPAYEQPLIERWDGAAWRVISGPTLPAGSLGGKLSGVVALSATSAWAVGEYYTADAVHVFIAQWDGAAWRFVSGPDTHGSLASVTASGPADVRAVGRAITSGSGSPSPLIEQWNGSAWTVVTSPQPSGALSVSLSDIATDGAGGFWVAGSYQDAPTTPSKALTLHCP